MDPALDPPPPVAAPPAPAIPVSPVLVPHNHPPFSEMISAAITALNERDGSSKRAIAKYIETHYSDLPPTLSDLLTHHLKHLKASGHLLMVKHSYTLPGLRSAPPPPAFNGPATTVESADPSPAAAKRRPGRPPKPKPDAVHVAVPVFPPPLNINDAPAFTSDLPSESAYIAAAVPMPLPVNGTTTPTGAPVRGRGRPPKSAKRGPGRPLKGGGGSGGRGRGRPKKSAAPAAAPAGQAKGPGRPRGRPPKPINVVEGFAPPVSGAHVAPVTAAPSADAPPVVTGKRRGRPPKPGNEAKKARNMNAALPKRRRNLSGKPLGRPRKVVAEATVNRTPDSHLLVAYLDLKAKLENLQSMVKQAATLIRPSLTSEAAVNAIDELELVALNASPPPNAQTQQQPQPEQVQPQS
ncbi:formin-like protein 5 [Salvia splendens]|uniref:formin-like protein 5 n=1 Tax=Salvia splendens TaxID=180675 RepID=UPI001C26695D|nr:formin-like protein 5 [Salvia splendens]